MLLILSLVLLSPISALQDLLMLITDGGLTGRKTHLSSWSC